MYHAALPASPSLPSSESPFFAWLYLALHSVCINFHPPFLCVWMHPSRASRHPILVAILTAIVILPALQASDVCTAGIAHHLPHSTDLTGTQSSTHPPLPRISPSPQVRLPLPLALLISAGHGPPCSALLCLQVEFFWLHSVFLFRS